VVMSEEDMVDRCCIKYEKFWSILRGCTARINGEGKRSMCVRELARGLSNYGDGGGPILYRPGPILSPSQKNQS